MRANRRCLKGDLVGFVQGILADELYDLSEILFKLKNTDNLLAKRKEVRIGLLIVGLKGAQILGEGVEPVQRGEVLALSELLVKTPENLR